MTIKDIARVAGVSHTTVSRALNNSASVKPETMERIRQIADDLHYVTNYSAKSLVHQKSYTVGLFFSSLDQGTSASFLVDVIKNVAKGLGGLYILSINGLDSMGPCQAVTPSRFDGIVLMSQSDSDNPFIYHVKEVGIPLVVLNRQLDDTHILNIVADDRAGVEEAIQRAASLGHRRIACINGRKGFRSAIERRQGYVDGMLAGGLTLTPGYIRDGDYSIESGTREMAALLALPERPTCVFCANDDMAIGAIKACQERGVDVPREVSIIGFDDILFSQYTSPALTTVHKPLDEISQFGTRKLLFMLQGESIKNKQHLIKTHLVERESLVPPLF